MVDEPQDRSEADEKTHLPLARPSGGLLWIWAATCTLIIGVSVYVVGPVWGAVAGVTLLITILLLAAAWSPGIAPAIAHRMIRWARRWPMVAVLVLGTSLILSSVAGFIHRYELEREEEQCLEAKFMAGKLVQGQEFEPAKIHLSRARHICRSGHLGEITVLEQKLKLAEAEALQRAARERVEREAVRDRAAAETFPERAAAARAILKKADGLVATGKIADGAGEYARAIAILEEFQGTSVEKTPEYAALEGEAGKVRQKVQPYLDQVKATLAEARRQLAEQAEQDRRDGVKITKEGYVAAASRDKLERAIKYVVANDQEGFALLLEQDPEVTILKAGVRVSVIERGGLVGGLVRVRIRGALDEFWTMPEALRDP